MGGKIIDTTRKKDPKYLKQKSDKLGFEQNI